MDDIQSWWEVPSIAHFCSLFRVAFNLLDFDIEELEEALLTDGAELTGSSLLQELIVRLLCGCLGNNGISVFNYQMFLRRLFRTKCRELGRENPFDTDIDFQFLPLRTKVEILHALCDFRLDADDVIDVLKNLDSDSLRVHPLGHDENKSAYWYFYGTRLYREDFPKKRKKKKDHEKQKSKRKRREEDSSSSSEDDEPRVGSWQVLCYTEDDWQKLAESLADSDCKEEQALYTVLTEDFLPEIPRLFEEKERLQRKRLLESQPRRTSSRLEKLKSQRKSKSDVIKSSSRDDRYYERERVNREKMEQRKRRALRALRRSRSNSESGSSACESIGTQFTGRQTNNSLASATGKIIIQPTRQKFRTSQLFRRTREDLMTGLYKVLDRLKTHEDAWPFVDPVEEEYAPKYYSVIAKPMDLQTMEDKLDNGEYGSLLQFKSDFQLIVDNCRQYNGSDNEYTQMVSRLQDAFRGLVDRYLEVEQSSDDDLTPPFIHREDTMGGNELSSPDRNNSRTTFTDSNSEVESDRKTPPVKGSSKLSDPSKENEGEPEEESHENHHKRRFRKKTRKKRSKREDDEEEGRSSSAEGERGGKSEDTSREQSRERARVVNYRERETSESDDFTDEGSTRGDEEPGLAKEDKAKTKKPLRKIVKRTGVIRNAAAIEALELATEQTLKDINKWLDDTPRFSDFSSNSNSPLHITCTEEMASIEGEYRRRLHLDRPMRPRDRFSNELHRRRMFKEQMGLKRRREVQRTIDRLQPGKSKGNLLSKENQQDGPGTETKFSSIDSDDNTPKISLGKVLASDLLGFGIGEIPRKESDDEYTQEKPVVEDVVEFNHEEKLKEEKEIRKEPILVDLNKDKAEGVKVEPKKEKPTPNLSAWFKAFGAPKPQNNAKKKPDEDSRGVENIKPLKDEEISVEEDRERRVCVIQSPARRQRKTSTGSSVSERSSFSQEPLDGNSPRPSLDEPYLSPQPELKTYYHPPINGTIKVGFYQDTCFPRGTSEKSSSPREIPCSSPRDVPSMSPRTPYCSPRNAPSPREYPNSPREYPNSPREYPNSPREYPNSPREYPNSPREYPMARSPQEYPMARSPQEYPMARSPKEYPMARSPKEYPMARSPKEYPMARSPKEYPMARSPQEYPMARSPKEYPMARSPKEYPMARSPKEYPMARSPKEYPMARSPQEYPMARSPKEASLREYPPPSMSPREAPPPSPKEVVPSPKPDYPTYTSAPNYQTPNARLYSSVPHYPSHIQYFDTSRPITDQYRNAEKTSVPIYPVKKRAYNDIESPQLPKSSPEPVSPPFKGGSFTPTKGAMEQERTFTPTPGRMPTQPLRVADSSIPMGLPHHPLQHHIMETYAEERHLSSPFFSGDGIYSKAQGSTTSHPMFAQPSVISSNFNREPPAIDRQQTDPSAQPYNRVLSPYHHKGRNENPGFPSSPPTEPPVKSKTPVVTYQNRADDSPDNSNTGPLNYSNAGGNSSHKDNTPTSVAFINRQSEVSKPSSPVNYNKVSNTDLLSGPKVGAPFSYSTNAIEDMFPSKVNSPYNRSIPQLAPGINYPPNADLGKMSVPPLSYGNQPELLAAKMNYNHPMADLMQTSSRYNYPMPELIQGKTGVYNQAVQDLIQSKASAYTNMVQGNLPGYNRPIADIIQSKVNELQGCETAFSPRTSQPLKPEPASKPAKKSRKKKNEPPAPSGFQQYVAPASEAITLKTATGVSGSAFNFGPPLKDSYSTYLEDMRSSYFVPHTEGSGPPKGATPSPSYFLGHASTRPPTYPHPFMNSQYQHFLQRHSEELLRPMMLHQGLLPPPAGYPAGYLGMHDAINRPSWL